MKGGSAGAEQFLALLFPLPHFFKDLLEDIALLAAAALGRLLVEGVLLDILGETFLFTLLLEALQEPVYALAGACIDLNHTVFFHLHL